MQFWIALLLFGFVQGTAAPVVNGARRIETGQPSSQVLFTAEGSGFNQPPRLFQDRPFDFDVAQQVFNTVQISPGNQTWVTDARNVGLQVILQFDFKWNFIEGLDIGPAVQSVINQIKANPGTVYGVYVADRLNAWAEPANGRPAIPPDQMIEYLRLTAGVIHQQLPGLLVFVDVEDVELTCGQAGQASCNVIQPGSTSIYRYENHAILTQLKNSGYVDGFLIADNLANTCDTVGGSHCWDPTVQSNAWMTARSLWPRPFRLLARTSRLSFWQNDYPGTDSLAQRQAQTAMSIPIQAGADGVDLWGWHIPWTDNGAPTIRTWLNKDAGSNLLWERMKQVTAPYVSSTTDTSPPTGTVKYPAGGEVLGAGTVALIVSDLRDAYGVASMVVDLSTDGGRAYADPFYRGAYSDTLRWTVPPELSDSCRVRVMASDGTGNQVTVTSGSLFSIRDATTGITEGDGPGELALSVRPTIARGPVTILFGVPRRSSVRVEVEDLMGRRRRVLAAAQYVPGQYTVNWDLTDDEGRVLESGIYFVRLEVKDKVLHRNLVVLH